MYVVYQVDTKQNLRFPRFGIFSWRRMYLQYNFQHSDTNRSVFHPPAVPRLQDMPLPGPVLCSPAAISSRVRVQHLSGMC